MVSLKRALSFCVPLYSSSSLQSRAEAFAAFQLPSRFAAAGRTSSPSSSVTTVSANNPLASLGRFFNPTTAPKPSKPLVNPIDERKNELLEAVSNTSNGKNATPDQQAKVLSIVRSLEADFPPSPELLADPAQAKELLDGPWYLQYTSPGTVGDEDRFPDAWKPQNAQEGSANVETTPFAAQGSVSAAGIPVETANRVVVQTIDVDQSRVTNDIGLEWGRLVAGGTFRPSTTVPNRALVSFDTFQFRFNSGFTFDVGFLFPVIKAIQRSQENGWLETTFVDQDVRIGRGNKGTMFVLTRRQDAVKA